MKFKSPNYGLGCLLCILFCSISSTAFSQNTDADKLTPVSKDFIDHGLKCFKTNLRRGRRAKQTEQVIVSYKALKQILDEANPDSNIQFILIGLDKKYPGPDTPFSKNNTGYSIDELHNKEAIIVKFASKTATAMNQPEGQQGLPQNTAITSSQKSAGNPLRQIVKNDTEKRSRAFAFPPVRYAIGRLCPPPVCDQY